jgi:hypothetical protein
LSIASGKIQPPKNYLDSLKSWSYSVISAMEVFAGARDKKEISALEKFFAAYREVPLSGDISPS